MYELINGPGVKSVLNEQGLLEILIEPEKAPFYPPGYIVYEIDNKGSKIEIDTHKCIFELADGLTSVNSMIIFNEEFVQGEFIRNDQKYYVTIIRNEHNRIGSIQIDCDNNYMSFNEVNNNLFEVGMEVINNISVQYTIPLYFSSFVILHKDLSHFTFIDKKEKKEEFIGVLLGAPTKLEYWHHASGSFRRALNSIDPMVKYLNLYIAIESLRVCLKHELGSENPHEEGRIQNKQFKEPILQESRAINKSKERFNIKQGETIYNLLFTDKYDFRKYRNLAAHTISKHDGDYKLTSNLNDYLDYSFGVVYLNSFFEIYLACLFKLTSK